MKDYMINFLIGMVILAVCAGIALMIAIGGIFSHMSIIGLALLLTAPILGKMFREDFLTTKKVEVLTLDSVIKIRYLETNEVHNWTLRELLNRVNVDNATDEFNYDISDWREGFNATLEGVFYSLLDESGNELNSLLDYQ